MSTQDVFVIAGAIGVGFGFAAFLYVLGGVFMDFLNWFTNDE